MGDMMRLAPHQADLYWELFQADQKVPGEPFMYGPHFGPVKVPDIEALAAFGYIQFFDDKSYFRLTHKQPVE
jgi:hypothetical protein